MDEIKQIAADHFKNATKEDINILVSTLKNKISAYLMRLNGLTSEEKIETTVFSKIKQIKSCKTGAAAITVTTTIPLIPIPFFIIIPEP